MGLFKRHKKVDPHEVGASIAQMGCSSDHIQFLLEGLPDASPSNAHAVLASLTLLACRRVVESVELNFSPASKQAIYNGLILELTKVRQRARARLGLADDAVEHGTEINERANVLAGIWNESVGMQPAPHHYVAKEAWFMICGDRSNLDPSRILLLFGSFSSVSITVTEFLRESRPLIQDL